MIEVTKGGEKCQPFADASRCSKAGEDIDYDGAAGPLDFVEVGEPVRGVYDTWEFDADGKVAVIEESIPVGGE